MSGIPPASKAVIGFAAAMVLLLSACSSERGASPSYESTPLQELTSTSGSVTASVQSSTSAVSPDTTTVWDANAARDRLHAELTTGEARDHFGRFPDIQEDYLYRNGQFVEAEQWTYEQDKMKLVLWWSPVVNGSQQLWDAILYDRDEAGKLRSFVPKLGALDSSMSSSDNALAKTNGIEVGGTVKLRVPAAGYDLLSGQAPFYNYASLPGRKLKVAALTRDFAKLEDEGYRTWIPTWYLTGEADRMKTMTPTVMHVSSHGAAAMWYPGSGEAVILARGDKAFVMSSYKDWYGVAVPDREINGDTYGFGLLWMKASDLTPDDQAGFSPYSSTSTENGAGVAAAIVRSALPLGATQAKALELLGKPQFKERSANILQPPGLLTLETWRYENADSQLELTWSQEGTLRNERFLDGTGKRDFGNTEWANSEEQVPRITTLSPSDGEQPFAGTKALTQAWRFQSELPYNYLIGKAGKTLLIEAEDGGFSGMHEQSILYGIDQGTGRKIWRHAFGFNGHPYAVSSDRRTVAFVDTKQTEDGKKTTYRLYALDTATGKELWHRSIQAGPGAGSPQMTGMQSGIGFAYAASNDKDELVTKLEMIDWRSGKKLSGQSFQGEITLIGQDGQQPYLLVQTGSYQMEATLRAYDTNGKIHWTLKGRSAESILSSPVVQSDTRYFAERPPGYWTNSGDSMLLTDAATGASKATLERGPRYLILNSHYAMKVTPNDGLTSESGSGASSELIELTTGRSLWKVPGKIEDALIDGERVFVRLNNRLVMADLLTGKERWSSTYRISGKMIMHDGNLLVESEPGIYAINAKDGKPLYRLKDQRTGTYDFTPEQFAYGMLTVLDGALYSGSSNGTFTRYK